MKTLKLLWILPFYFLFSCQPTPTHSAHLETKKHLPPDERYGSLFVDVQMAQVFPDGKTFVDCTPKLPTDEILAAYEIQKKKADFDLKDFVLQYFEKPKNYASHFKTDLTKSPEEHINSLWPVLTREPDASTNGTLIPLPYPYIVPGGRFGEIYYWDSYFTMLGLQASGKTRMIENMVNNFSFLLDSIHYIPNGNRTYFLGRSQPPFFSLMVGVLAEMEGDSIYRKYLPQLEEEYSFWMEGADSLSANNPIHRRVVRLGDGTILNRYWDDHGSRPRPESYREDVETAKNSGRPAAEIYQNIRAACESGWDFSSRWFQDGQSLATIHTTDILPPDLNSLLYNLEICISKGYLLNSNEERAAFFRQKAIQRKDAINRYNWFAPAHYYLDFDYAVGEPTYIPSLAGVYPLFFNIASPEQAAGVAAVIQEDFLRPGGVLTTLKNTGQQWDAPNGWAPLQWMCIKGLRNYGYTNLADRIKKRWTDLNARVFKNTGKMVEKYNVQDIHLEAGGGEYPVQDGFGWTNGVFLKLVTEEKQ